MESQKIEVMCGRLVTLQMSKKEKKVSWRLKINQGERRVLWWTPDLVSVELSQVKISKGKKILKVIINLRSWKPGNVP